MTQYKLVTAMLFVAVFAPRAEAESSKQIIAAERIVAAINDVGIEVSAEQVTLLTDVFAKTRDPDLRIESVVRWDSHKIRVRLDCVEVEECLPFFVAVLWDQGDAVPVPLRRIRPGDPVVTVATARAYTVVVRSASPAILRLDGSHSQVWIPVVCMENGAIGQWIYATSRDGRQIYEAEVLGSRRLRGKL